jgi:hypothetical protein
MKKLALLLFISLGACTPDFTEQWEVKKPRLMVAKLIIDGDSERRTRPRAGESFSIRYYMMSPEKPQESYSIDVATCIGAVLPNGTLACYDEAPFADLSVEPYADDDQLLVHGFQVPAELDALPPPFDLLDRVSTFGTACVDGRVERLPGKSAKDDPISEVFRCVDNEAARYKTPLPFTMSIFLDRGRPSQLNHHPSFDCDPAELSGPCHEGIRLHGERVAGPIVLERPKKVVDKDGGDRILAWPDWDDSEPLPWDRCAEAPDSLPKLRAESGEYKVRVRFDKGDRELYEREIEENGRVVIDSQREELIVSHAITTRGGELDGYADAVARETPDDEAEIEIEYTPPAQSDKERQHIDDAGRLVRFYFALRDQRGGTDFTTRELCVLPPED